MSSPYVSEAMKTANVMLVGRYFIWPLGKTRTGGTGAKIKEGREEEAAGTERSEEEKKRGKKN